MTRVLFLAYHFPPIGGAGVQRNTKFARYLPDFGYEPVVVTGSGGGSGRWTPPDETLLGKLRAETEVHRVPGPEPAASTGWRGRAERWLGVDSPHLRWLNDGTVALGREAREGVGLVYASLEPYGSAAAAARVARELGVPWVADLQDPWALDEMWVSPTALHRRRDVARMGSALATAAAIVMNTPEAVARVRQRFPRLPGRLVSITNGFDARDFAAPAPEREAGPFRIVHTGSLHTERGRRLRRTSAAKRLLGGSVPGVDILTRSPVFLLEAIDRLVAARPELRSRIEVHLAGPLTGGDREAVERSPYVRLRGYLPHDETIALIRSADMLFLPMQDLPPGTRATIIPGKTYEYLASGRPILAAVPDGDGRELLERAGTAYLCRPPDSAAMAAAIASELDRVDAGQAPRPADPEVLAPYERVALTATLAAVFDEVLGLERAAARDAA